MCTLACIPMCIIFIGKKYPVIERLRDGKEKTCENNKLKLEKSFTVDRIERKRIPPEWEFTATLGTKELSSLIAEKGGICNGALTHDGSKQCGLATVLTEHCFTDDKVGDVDIQNNEHFKKESLKTTLQRYRKTC